VHDVSPAQLAHKRRQVYPLVHERSQVLHSLGKSQRSRERRVDWNKPRIDVRIVSPRAQEAVRLDGLPAENF